MALVIAVMLCLHDPAIVQQTSSKRPAIHVYFEFICWKFAGSCKHPLKGRHSCRTLFDLEVYKTTDLN